MSRLFESKLSHALLSLVGLALLAGFVWKAGASAILVHLRQLGLGIVLLMAVALAWRALETLAMWLLFPKGQRPPWWRLFAVRTFGESLNVLTPLMGFGGEPVKALLLRGHVGDESTTGYLLLDKTVFFAASVSFMLTGTLPALALVRGSQGLVAALLALTCAWLAALYWLAHLQSRGRLVTLGLHVARKVGLTPGDPMTARLDRVDETLRRAYQERPAQLRLALAVHFIGRLLRVPDVWLCAWLLDIDVSLGGAYAVAATATLVGAVFAFIPGALGAYEGSQALVLAQFGIDMAGGLAVGLIRHLRNWLLAALAYTTLYFAARAPAARKRPLSERRPAR